MKKLILDPDFVPCTPVVGEETLGGFPSNWNITRTREWVGEKLEQVELSVVPIIVWQKPGAWVSRSCRHII